AGAGGKHREPEGRTHRARQHPLAVGGEVEGSAVAEAYRWRSVGGAQEDAVAGATRVPALAEHDLAPVLRQVGQERKLEPGEVALVLLVADPGADLETEGVAREQHAAVAADVAQDQPARRAVHEPLAAAQGDRVQGQVGPYLRPRKPHLVARRR